MVISNTEKIIPTEEQIAQSPKLITAAHINGQWFVTLNVKDQTPFNVRDVTFLTRSLQVIARRFMAEHRKVAVLDQHRRETERLKREAEVPPADTSVTDLPIIFPFAAT